MLILDKDKVIKEQDSCKRINQELEALFNCSYDGIWICDKKGTILRINKASEQLNNIKAETLIGRDVKDLVAKGYLDKSVTLEVLEKKRSVTFVRERVKGKKILITGNPVFDGQGNITLIVMNERDITELNQLREQLEETKTLSNEYSSELQKLKIWDMELKGIVSRSKEMLAVLDLAQKVSKVNTSVLLLGESGVGKGIIAGLIHRLSERRDGPFMHISCGALPDSLIETELFGYDKGAFTGAREKGKPGLFELANQGTLFIDEVSEIPLNLQGKILKFLEDNEIIRVGGVKWQKIDTRIIAATNRDLKKMMQKDDFREDLYYRLSVIIIQIPALRERKVDIPPLIHFFLNYFNRKHGLQKKISQDAVSILCSYSYRGNVRELKNIIENLVVLGEGDLITERDLPIKGDENVGFVDPILAQSEQNLREHLLKVEEEIIFEAIKKYKTTTKAARALGVSQPTIVRKLQKYHITH